ncbi:MAG: hypothetical protein FGM40_08695, partial [Rhodocyclaceae bacterium]|nr:hypothetical protein [Rhodocyclaceae bacterium]
HTPSEHTVDRVAADMEVHLVHLKIHDNGKPYCIGEPGSLLVIGTLIREGRAHAELDKIFGTLPQPAVLPDPTLEFPNAQAVTVKNFNFRKLIPDDSATYRYHGSLTAPSAVDCSSGGNLTNTLNGNLGIDIYDSSVAEQLADESRAEDGTFPEVVQWIVNTKSITMSTAQIDRFHALFDVDGNSHVDGNSRPVQDLNGRVILRMPD